MTSFFFVRRVIFQFQIINLIFQVNADPTPDSDIDDLADDTQSVGTTVGEVVKLRADRSGPLNKPIAVQYLLSDTSSDTEAIGRLGEELVYQHLRASVGAKKEVVWVNEASERCWPFDIVLCSKVRGWSIVDVAAYAGRWRDMVQDYPETHFIEVKSSLSPTKPLFEMSMGELEMARECDKHYSLYRLRGLGPEMRPRLECIRRPLLAFNSRYFALIAHETQQQMLQNAHQHAAASAAAPAS